MAIQVRVGDIIQPRHLAYVPPNRYRVRAANLRFTRGGWDSTSAQVVATCREKSIGASCSAGRVLFMNTGLYKTSRSRQRRHLSRLWKTRLTLPRLRVYR